MSDIRTRMIDPWRATYGAPPVGLVLREDARQAVGAAQAAAERPRAVVVGHDEDVIGCLAVNDVAGHLGVDLVVMSPDGGTLLAGPGRALGDPSVPIVVLHDASVPGLLFHRSVRDRAGAQRVHDGGLTVAQARRAGALFMDAGIRWDPVQVPPGLVDDGADHQWLAMGCSLALAAVPPNRLIAAVDRAVMKLVVASADDRDVERARAVGFL